MSVRILVGDALAQLRTLEPESVQCCVTSPPYWGLRDYGVEGQIGLETTPAEYVERMVEVFSAVRGALRKDGTLWLNIGDSYTTGASVAPRSSDPKAVGDVSRGVARVGTPSGMKPKDLVGIPWMLAFALRADGWFLRSDIIWAKPNPMPESVTDRPTKAHEYVFLLAKSERYYYDAAAVAEQAAREYGPGWDSGEVYRTPGESEKRTGLARNGTGHNNGFAKVDLPPSTRNRRTVWNIATQPFKGSHFATMPPELAETCVKAGSMAHGAVLPIEYIETPLGERAGDDPSMVTGRAGMNRPRGEQEGTRRMSRYEHEQYAAQLKNSPNAAAMAVEAGGESTFAHYRRTDRSGARPIPPHLLASWIDRGWLTEATTPIAHAALDAQCTVLDPFGGAGTTGLVADRLGRSAILIELNPKYADIAEKRLNIDAGFFADVEVA